MKRSSTDTLVQALRILADEIECEDGVATACISEAAYRIEELQKELCGNVAVLDTVWLCMNADEPPPFPMKEIERITGRSA